MKILVTGGGGFLGTEICRQLLDRGHVVASLSRSDYPHLKDMGVRVFRGDLAKNEIPDLGEFEAVFHTAAKAGVWGKKEDFHNNNFVASEKLLEASKLAGVKYFIYTSSPSVVFGKDDIEGADEGMDYPENYFTEYSRSKAMAEKIVLKANQSDFKTVSIRPHLIWGEGDPHLIPRIIAKAKSGKLKIVGDANNLVDVIHVTNAAHAHVLALEALKGGQSSGGKSYFVGQERPVLLWEFINQILHQAGLEGVEDKVSFEAAYFIGYVLEKTFKILGVNNPEPPMTRFVALQLAKSHYFSHEQAKIDLGYAPLVSVEEGLLGLFQEKKKKLKLISELPAQ